MSIPKYNVGDIVAVSAGKSAISNKYAGQTGVIEEIKTSKLNGDLIYILDIDEYKFGMWEEELTFVGHLPQLPLGYTSPWITLDNEITESRIECECGQKGVEYAKHSDYCPLYEKETRNG